VLQHVSLETRPADAEAAIAFWALLGFAEVPPPPTLRGVARWVERGGTQIHLLLTHDPVAPPAGHAAVVVDDYDATLARLREAGHAPAPSREHWGAPRAFVRTPGGHRVELMSAPPQSGG
jgi:catechol 2,3-dioxygenase-like lactoylglutathione lyase family enzyme